MACGLIGGGHSPGCASDGTPVLGLVARLDEVTGVGVCNARVFIAELGTDMSVFPTPGDAAARARLTSRTLQSGNSARPGRAGKGNPYLRGALGQCVMAAARTDTRLGEQYRRIARRRGKQKAIVAVSRVICEIACILISDPGARFTDLRADYYSRGDSRRQTRSRIRELERLNPGMKVTLTPVQQAAEPCSRNVTSPLLITRRSCHQHSPYSPGGQAVPRRPVRLAWLAAAHHAVVVSGQGNSASYGLLVSSACVPAHRVDLCGERGRLDDWRSAPRRHGQQVGVVGDDEQRPDLSGQVEDQVVLVVGAVVDCPGHVSHDLPAAVLGRHHYGTQVSIDLRLGPFEQPGPGSCRCW